MKKSLNEEFIDNCTTELLPEIVATKTLTATGIKLGQVKDVIGEFYHQLLSRLSEAVPINNFHVSDFKMTFSYTRLNKSKI